MVLPFAGVFTGTPADGLTRSVLIHTTKESELVDPMRAQMAGEDIASKFKPSGQEYAIAIRLTGKFKTAFPNGKPEEKKENGAAQPADAAGKDGKAKDDKKKDQPKSLKESGDNGLVVLVGDSDLLYDQFTVQTQDILGQRVMIPSNGNLNFIQGLVELAAGDSNLVRIRSRGDAFRPFQTITKMEAEAEARFQEKIRSLEDSLQETQRRLGELQASKKDADQRFILSPEQQTEIERFRKEEANANRELRQVRKDLRREIDALENMIKALNIAGMPLLMIGVGVAVGIVRKRRTKAQ